MLRPVAFALMAITFSAAVSGAQPTTVSLRFDFSHSEIGLKVTVRGHALYMLLDTGVNPSVIDLSRAKELGLKIDYQSGGESSGFGGGRGASMFPTSIDHLKIGGRDVRSVDALASDLSAISGKYGRRVDGILGYSFLSGKILLIDYPDRTLTILARDAQSKRSTATCGTRWTTRFITVNNYPVIPRFRFGNATAPVSLDTGSNGDIALFQSALALPGVRSSLVKNGAMTHMGFRGDAKSTLYTFNAEVGFGPFSLPPGQPMFLLAQQGSVNTRVANVGNRLLDTMKLKMLLDYRRRTMTFYGDCR